MNDDNDSLGLGKLPSVSKLSKLSTQFEDEKIVTEKEEILQTLFKGLDIGFDGNVFFPGLISSSVFILL